VSAVRYRNDAKGRFAGQVLAMHAQRVLAITGTGTDAGGKGCPFTSRRAKGRGPPSPRRWATLKELARSYDVGLTTISRLGE
jgi:hypothetical protein